MINRIVNCFTILRLYEFHVCSFLSLLLVNGKEDAVNLERTKNRIISQHLILVQMKIFQMKRKKKVLNRHGYCECDCAVREQLIYSLKWIFEFQIAYRNIGLKII